MHPSPLRFARWATTTLAVCAPLLLLNQEDATPTRPKPSSEKSVQLHYLEIVTPDVDSICRALAQLHGVTFSEPVVELGGARTASLQGGGQLGVRAPMRESEEPVVRPYALVKDIEAAVEAAEAAGAELAMPPTEIPGRGRFAIYFQGGIQHGLWEL